MWNSLETCMTAQTVKQSWSYATAMLACLVHNDSHIHYATAGHLHEGGSKQLASLILPQNRQRSRLIKDKICVNLAADDALVTTDDITSSAARLTYPITHDTL